jgi:HPt (histidine-containing phosphotransfer) domain-containing protein
MTASAVRSAAKRSPDASAGIIDGEPDIIDEEHLRRMTLGDRRLEREVLQIFVRQSAVMLGRIAEGEPAVTAAAAHTLSGSARGIGAWRVARAAERLERASEAGSQRELSDAIAELKAASLETSAAIGARSGD